MPKHIVITGPESSGKTTLAKLISKRLGIDINREYARFYLSSLDRNYTINDLEKMAEIQDYLIQLSLVKVNKGLCVSDTDLLTFKIWSTYKFGYFEADLQRKLDRLKPDLYIICKPDIPWVDDPLRENPTDRDDLFNMYLDEIIKIGVAYMIVEGEGDVRGHEVLEYLSGELE